MRMRKKHLSYVLMYHKKAAIFLKQQDHRKPHVPKNYSLHLIRICVKHVSIFNCLKNNVTTNKPAIRRSIINM